jgi:hypothetical protein
VGELPIADAGDRPPFFDGFSSRDEFRAAMRQLEQFLQCFAIGAVGARCERNERLVEDFPSQRALRHAVARLEAQLCAAGRSEPACLQWSHKATVAERN